MGDFAVSENLPNHLSRRDLLVNSGRVAAATTLASMVVPHVHAAQNNTIQVALVGCGGRGGGAANEALSSKNGPTKLVAMADVFERDLAGCYRGLSSRHDETNGCAAGAPLHRLRRLQKAMDCLKPGDVVILATPPAFRWVHFTYAIEKGLNVFMEKPITVDGPSSRKMLELGEEVDGRI